MMKRNIVGLGLVGLVGLLGLGQRVVMAVPGAGDRPLAQLSLAQLAATSGSVTVTDQVSSRTSPNSVSPRKQTIHYPLLSGLADPALLAKVQAAVTSEQMYFGWATHSVPVDSWTTDLTYEVNYNQDRLLSMSYQIVGVGAYVSGYTKHVAVNLETGNVIRLDDMFKPLALGMLAQRLDGRLQAEIKAKIAQIKVDDPQFSETSLFANHRFRIRNLEKFSISAQGVTFYYDYGFPHVALAYEPSGRFLMPFSELQPSIKSAGVLGFAVAAK
jgi:hypothetical protein